MFLYLHTYTGSASGTTVIGGLSTDLMVTLGVGIVTLAAIILVSCCTKKRRNNQIQGEPIMYSSGIAWYFPIHSNGQSRDRQYVDIRTWAVILHYASSSFLLEGRWTNFLSSMWGSALATPICRFGCVIIRHVLSLGNVSSCFGAMGTQMITLNHG